MEADPPSAPESAPELRRHDAEALPPVLTIDEAARFLRVNRKTLYDAVRQRRVPGVVRLGRSIRIGRDALLSWMQGNGSPALGDDR